ncbi:MAG TPA: hypothetical protein H9913_11995, partial [Candidatus Blautia stercoripullorum]|nr:hypothetical protein [Candidatus Blautia stercoripullorum]
MENINVSDLLGYFDILTWGICLCIKYAFKTAFNKIPKKWMPGLMLLCGVLIRIIIYRELTAENIFTGMFSGILMQIASLNGHLCHIW